MFSILGKTLYWDIFINYAAYKNVLFDKRSM